MSYSPKLPDHMLHELWVLRKYCAQGSIAGQIRTAIQDYLLEQVKKLGCPISDVEEVIDRYDEQKRSNKKREPVQ